MALSAAATSVCAPASTAGASRNFSQFQGLRPTTPAQIASRPSYQVHCRRVVAPRALDVDSGTAIGVAAAIAGLAAGIAIPVFYEIQVKGASSRENDQPCFPCKGTGSLLCRFCQGQGVIVVDLGMGSKEESQCINCEGNGSVTCTTCNGSGVQPRYLDRREFRDDD
eukprot:TRINITY_DN17301_c0_g1_i1.p1 TRINITY_DN17301_c0_g1~~TRINITY_DN17301_c0_g1_i1.p1  ORF type:complete len:167 (+),score=14.17 TRINITY_DN17301_c0_g1_i1:249-749(+)